MTKSIQFGALAAGAGVLLSFVGAAVVAQTPATEDKSAQQDKEKIQKELQDLESQRAKLDSRIGELRKKAGKDGARTYIYSDGNVRVFGNPGAKAFVLDGKGQSLKDLTPEQRKHVEEAMAEAKKALEKARKELPEGFVMPDVEGILKNSMVFRTFPNGQKFEFATPVPFDSPKFKADMEKLKDMAKSNANVYRSYVLPKGYTAPNIQTVPAVPGFPFRDGGSPELRGEIRELRQELEKLREELRKDRGGKKEQEDRKIHFLEPFTA